MPLIYTTKGYLEDSLLAKTEGEVDNDNERTTWTEYRLEDEVVRRDVHVHLKLGLDLASAVGGF
jgi:negative regulator of sigma E activity